MRILIVEDNIELGQLYREWLSEEGHDVCIITDGIEALQLMISISGLNGGSLNFDAFVIDYHLPTANGMRVIEMVKAINWKNKAHPFLLISGDIMAFKGLEASISKLEKPFVKEDFMKALGITSLAPVLVA